LCEARSSGPYNGPMHPRHLVFAVLLACSALAAQTVPAPPLVQEAQPLEPRKNQKVEHIHLEDSGSVIDEVRYGGQTQSITVQPKANVPEYEIQPTDLAHSRPTYRDGGSSPHGQRVWNLFHF
jgi:starvation-inducible outer membrane lipoprotein